MTEHDLPADGQSTPEPAEGAGLVGFVAVGPGEPSTSTAGGRSRPRDGDPVTAHAEPAAPVDPGDAALLALVDRLAGLLDRGDLAEVEVGAGATTIVVRSAAWAERAIPAAFIPPAEPAANPPAAVPAPAAPVNAPARPSVKAPLTGIFYGAPSPGATPYVAVGDHVSVGQIIGLIEAMKLFNEIKSDLAGRVIRVCADNGQLVKAKQALIEVEPA